MKGLRSQNVSELSWKSGASVPRKEALTHMGFSPGAPQGLKVGALPIRDAALEGPLFHVTANNAEATGNSARVSPDNRTYACGVRQQFWRHG